MSAFPGAIPNYFHFADRAIQLQFYGAGATVHRAGRGISDGERVSPNRPSLKVYGDPWMRTKVVVVPNAAAQASSGLSPREAATLAVREPLR